MKETKYEVKTTSQFRREYKLAMKRGFDIGLLDDVIKKLSMGEPLPEKNRDHALSGKLAAYRECHILSDWLLIYQIRENVLILTLSRTGSHSDLF
ncbi:MAG: type II toxin-antitoxin system YafQ family toxin [Selenomonadaceae bacterium]|nr:type II toxin-antitoxin system YafQ family toxin [Selenomonadaceae bacterium]